MAASFAKKSAAMLFQMTNQVDALHIAKSGRRTEPLTNDLRPAKLLLSQ
jgi:hypothetical protein